MLRERDRWKVSVSEREYCRRWSWRDRCFEILEVLEVIVRRWDCGLVGVGNFWRGLSRVVCLISIF